MPRSRRRSGSTSPRCTPSGSALTRRCTCPGCSTRPARRPWTRSSASSPRPCPLPSASSGGRTTPPWTSGTPPAGPPPEGPGTNEERAMSPHDATEIPAMKIHAQDAEPRAAADRKLGLALLVIATAQLMLVLDDTIVNVALPSIQRSLHLATPSLNWVISFYALAFGGLLLAGGRVGDLFGRLRLFRIVIIVFALASMAGGFAPNGTVLIIARLVQGCGAAIAAPGALSLLATTFPPGPVRTKALGVYGSMAGVGSVMGLLLGGTLTEYVSWRWVLFINAPIAVLVLIGSRVLVPGEREQGSLDVAGAATVTLGIGSAVFALTR